MAITTRVVIVCCFKNESLKKFQLSLTQEIYKDLKPPKKIYTMPATSYKKLTHFFIAYKHFWKTRVALSTSLPFKFNLILIMFGNALSKTRKMKLVV